ncbi:MULTISPECIES: phage antirepressor KilAC domain-containing protein [unclassified Cryobacterium]|uniref:phage antirepressor KilAC domain-containing protein n=1 Tax=unclassified Cryobacterium TaxID=2649013 RepID=UPI00141BF022|nr:MULTISPECIES: phage antirepressor KilAC domain-containing protein [unclassified Cryobacterium]
MHPRFFTGIHHVDVCATIADGRLEFVARDVLAAVDQDLGDYAGDCSHEPPIVYAEHATARTWSRATIGSILATIADRPNVAAFLYWLDERIDILDGLGLDSMERQTRFGGGHQVAKPAIGEPAAVVLPEHYSVGAVGRILSRDPGIGSIGRVKLFEQMNKLAWVTRVGNTWKPTPDLVRFGYLLEQKVAVPGQHDAYPQVLVTPAGIEALHKRLGGTADLNIEPSDHLTLIGTP